MAGGIDNPLQSLVQLMPREYRDRWMNELKASIEEYENVLVMWRRTLGYIMDANDREDHLIGEPKNAGGN